MVNRNRTDRCLYGNLNKINVKKQTLLSCLLECDVALKKLGSKSECCVQGKGSHLHTEYYFKCWLKSYRDDETGN